MSDANFNPSLSLVLAHEGGFVNNPKDPGGPTNKGVTQKVYDRHRKAKNLPIQSVKLISDAEVAEIYRNDYWNMLFADKMPVGIDYAVFDYSVNSGISRAIADLQRTINENANYYGVSGQLNVDGVCGQATIGAVEKAGENGAEKLIEDYCARRLAFCKTLKTWKTFGAGWERRIEGAHDGAQDDDDGVVDIAAKMAKAPVVVANVAKPEKTPDVPGATVVIPPAPIGAREGEAPGKAYAAQVAMLKTAQGVGAALAAAGVTGNTALDAAGTVKGHINGTLIGQLALIVFVLLMVAGVGLIVYKFFHDRNEKHAA